MERSNCYPQRKIYYENTRLHIEQKDTMYIQYYEQETTMNERGGESTRPYSSHGAQHR